MNDHSLLGGLVQHHELGLHHISLGEYEKAEFHFVQLTHMSPLPVFSHNAGKACMEQMKLQDAERHFRNAIDVDPDHAAAHYDLSLVLGLQGKWKEFFEEYEWRNEYFSDLKYYRDLYTFGRKVFVCKNGPSRSFLMLPTSFYSDRE